MRAELMGATDVDGGVLVTVKSVMWGVQQQVLPTTREKVKAYFAGKTGYVQEYFSELNSIQREFLVTGCPSQEAWDQLMGPEEN